MLLGCASSHDAEPEPNPAMIDPPSSPVQIMTRSHDVELGRSVKGTPITLRIFGSGSPTVFIMGGIHGDETTSVDLTTNLIEVLEKNPTVYAGKRVAILRVANPDGYAAKKRVNAHSVDLNRNFPASNYKGSRRYGKESASEPETRAILSALDQLNPALIISIHSIDNARQCNNYDGPAEAVAKLMSQYNKYPVAPNIGYPTPGSMGTYCGIDRKIPMITLELPRSASGEESWTKNKDALLAAIRGSK
jgi:protein MpaA